MGYVRPVSNSPTIRSFFKNSTFPEGVVPTRSILSRLGTPTTDSFSSKSYNRAFLSSQGKSSSMLDSNSRFWPNADQFDRKTSFFSAIPGPSTGNAQRSRIRPNSGANSNPYTEWRIDRSSVDSGKLTYLNIVSNERIEGSSPQCLLEVPSDTPLPLGWQRVDNPNGKYPYYYWNPATAETRWEFPVDLYP